MIRMIGLALIAALKGLFCKGVALGLVLLTFVFKGRQLDYDTEKWNDYFLSLEEKKVEKYAVGVYLSAAMLSSIAAYGVLQKLKYRHSFPLAAAMFLAGLAVTWYRWKTKGREYLIRKYREIPETILAERRKEETHS